MVSSGHSPRPPNEAPLKTSPENTNKSEVTTWTGQLVRIEQTDFINNTIQIQKENRRVLYITNKPVTSDRSSESGH
ncbi:hypothetical protein MTP99_009427 [Tenebrio molitor]|nr:hypothetical protein MTP99_009427 [Tenebrio molitor]